MKGTPSVGDNSFGRYLREQRLLAGLSQRHLAELLGTSRSYLSRLEAGEQSNPSTEFVSRLVTTLRIDDTTELFALLGFEPTRVLPSAHVFFRRKYGLSEGDAFALERLLEDYTHVRGDNTSTNQGGPT